MYRQDRRILPLFVALGATWALTACDQGGPEDDGGDPVDGTFLSDGKADGAIQEGTLDAVGVLRVANESSKKVLDKDVKLDSRAVSGILKFRSGKDGKLGTPDDATFATLKQLDDVPYVGTQAFDRLLAYAKAHHFVPTAPTIHGVVRLGDGTPAMGANVYLGLWYQPQASASADAKGAYSMTVAAGTYGLAVRYMNWAGPARTDVWITVDPAKAITQNTTLDITLPTVLFKGRILDDAGAPVAGVEVTGACDASPGSDQFHSANFAVVSAADGTFSVPVMAGTYPELMLQPPAGAYAKTRIGEIDLTQAVTRDFVIARGAVLSGVVRLADGTPAVGANVYLGLWYKPDAASMTDANGVYRIAVTAGTYALAVRYMNWNDPARTDVWITVDAAQAITADTTLDITLPTVRFEGRVLDDAGAPVAGVAVTGGCNGAPTSDEFHTGSFRATTAADGTFSVPIMAGTYPAVTLEPPAGPYAKTLVGAVDLTSDLTRDFVIIRGVELSGVVRLADGTPAASANVYLGLWYQSDAAAYTDQGGGYHMTLAPGSYALAVRYLNWNDPARTDVWITLDPAKAITEDTSLDITLPTVLFSGRVLDEQGNPVAGVAVTGACNASADPDQFHSGSFRATSAADGTFSVPVMAGSYPSVTLEPSAGPYAKTLIGSIDLTHAVTRDLVVLR